MEALLSWAEQAGFKTHNSVNPDERGFVASDDLAAGTDLISIPQNKIVSVHRAIQRNDEYSAFIR
jgi:hypothetical protein